MFGFTEKVLWRMLLSGPAALVECFLKVCMKRSVFRRDERPADRIQTSLAFECEARAGTTGLETLAIQFVFLLLALVL